MHPSLSRLFLDKIAVGYESLHWRSYVCVGLPVGRLRLPMVRNTANIAFISITCPIPAKTE